MGMEKYSLGERYPDTDTKNFGRSLLVLSSTACLYQRRSILDPLYNLYQTYVKKKLVVYFSNSYDVTNF